MVSCGYEVLLPQRSLMYFSKCRHSTIWLCHRLSILSRAFLRENLLVLFSVIPKSYSIIQRMVQPCWARGHVPGDSAERGTGKRVGSRGGFAVFFSSASSWAGRDVSRAANGGDSVSLTPYIGGAGGVSGIRRRRALRFQPARRGAIP